MRAVAGWAIQISTVICLVFDQLFTNHLAYLLGASVVHVQDQHFFSIILNKIVGLLCFLIAAGSFRLLAVQLSAKQSNSTKGVVVNLSIGLATSLIVFSTNVYPRIPLALGGGDFPVVRVEFAEGTPYQVTMNLDVSHSDPKYQGHRYYARLIHREKDLLYLGSPFWFSSTVFEVRSKDILMLEYGSFNPTAYIISNE